MLFRDYFAEIQEIDASLSRKENLAKLREAHKTWRRRESTDARNMENLILSAISVFGHESKYTEFREKWEAFHAKHSKLGPEQKFRSLVVGAASDGIINLAEYNGLIREATRMGIRPGQADEIISKVALEMGTRVCKEESSEPSATLWVSCGSLELVQRSSQVGLSGSFTISNHGTGPLRGEVLPLQGWILINPTRIASLQHSQQISVTVDTTQITPGVTMRGSILISTNGGDAEIAISATPAVAVERLKQFKIGLTIAVSSGGASLGALLGMLGRGGAVIAFLSLPAALGFWGWDQLVWKHSEETVGYISKLSKTVERLGGKGPAVFYSALGVGLLALLWTLCAHIPPVGGIMCSSISLGMLAPLFSDELFLYQARNRDAISKSSAFAWKANLLVAAALASTVLLLIVILCAVLGTAFVVLMLLLLTLFGGGCYYYSRLRS